MYSQVWDFPQNLLNFENFKIYAQKGKMITGLKNVAIMTSIALASTIIMGTMVAYVITRFNFRGKSILLFSFILASILPQTTTAIATFTIIRDMGLYNTIWAGSLLYSAAGVLEVYIFMQFMYKVPLELDQSARIDGSSYWRVYRSIILPLLRPAIATISILKIVNIYNDFFIPVLYMPSPKLSTITYGLYLFTSDRVSQWNIMSAGMISVLLPTLIIYLFMQRFIISGVAEGSVKS